ncbi:MAG TPA: prephenate dehydrogenase/arogenate dehydrogenase family protein [Burkholderiaceae bacterium]|nr:prephenate dehydrogenase/arogenate dehydrogenase family protein [Burkholderiaceae bacterium]
MKLALLGCGLLGGSLAAAWRQSGRAAHVTGFDVVPQRAHRALELGIIERAAPTVADAVADADCIVLATPVGSMGSLLSELQRHARNEAVITDVGSTKVEVIAQAQAALGDTFGRFVPAHPIAGGALPGIEHASADLFRGCWVITTPQPQTHADAVGLVETNWAACGANIERMSAHEHDRIFAAVSHLPHLLAFALVHLVASQPDGERKLRFAGAGFRDFTRIAASDPVMWRDIALANRGALSLELAQFRTQLEELQRAVDAADAVALERLFAQASQVRRAQTFRATSNDHDV